MTERIRYAGFAEETIYGEQESPTFHVDIASSTMDIPTDAKIPYLGGLSRARNWTRPGYYAPTGNVTYAFDIESIAPLLKWALGGYDFEAGTDAPNTHEIWGSHDLLMPSFTTVVGKDVFQHSFTGSVINSLTISVDNEYTMVTADLVTAGDVKDTIVPIGELLLSDDYPMVFHEVMVTRTPAGEDPETLSARVKRMELVINNNADADAGRRLGNRHPVNIPLGAREINLTLDLFYEDTTELDYFWSDEESEIVITFTAAVGELEDPKGMVITIPKLIVAEVRTQPSGIDEIVQTIVGHAFLDDVVREINPLETENTELHVLVTCDMGEIKPPVA